MRVVKQTLCKCSRLSRSGGAEAALLLGRAIAVERVWLYAGSGDNKGRLSARRHSSPEQARILAATRVRLSKPFGSSARGLFLSSCGSSSSRYHSVSPVAYSTNLQSSDRRPK